MSFYRSRMLEAIYAEHPELRPPLDEDLPPINSRLRWKEVKLPESISEADLDVIIFSMLTPQLQKAARVISTIHRALRGIRTAHRCGDLWRPHRTVRRNQPDREHGRPALLGAQRTTFERLRQIAFPPSSWPSARLRARGRDDKRLTSPTPSCPAIIRVEFSAALPPDRGAARGGGGVGRDAEGAAQAVGAAAG